MASLASLCGSLDGADWLQTLADDASVLTALDAFFSKACAAQAKRLELSALPDEEIQTLHDDGRVAFALYMRLLRVLQEDAAPLKPAVLNAMRSSLLHVARLLPFCQLFGLRNPQRVKSLVDAALQHVEATQTDLKQLRGVYVAHFERIHTAAALNKRPQVVDLIQSIYEASLSVHTLVMSSSALELLFGSNESETLASDSLLRALAVCYEADLPNLQRNLSKLDDKAQKRAALLIPESRRLLLQILDAVIQYAMDQERTAGGTGESVLTIIHDLSHSTEADTTDHGSFVSDLWHLCGKEAKLLEYFGQVDLDRDSVSYLEVVLEGLPRRRVVDETPPGEKKQNAASPAVTQDKEDTTSADASSADRAAAPAVDVDSLISQVRDLFPDLGDGYVALCLLSSQHELETVINYLLESNPPPALSGVSTSLKRSDAGYAALERKALGKEPLGAAAPQPKSEKIDPSRIWKGKRAQEKHYDPQVARKDPSIVEKVKQIVDEYAEEENFLEAARQAVNTASSNGNSGDSGFVLDEYDDDYNDEYEDYEPFSVHDGGQAEDFDAIRLQNRRLRALEAEDAFWEGMRNQNRRAVDMEDADEEDDEDESKEDAPGSSQYARGPARGEWKPSAKQTNSAPQGRGGGGGRGDGSGGQAGTPGGPMTEQQLQRQRQRDNKNKAKVGNHHRKDRALKKRG